MKENAKKETGLKKCSRHQKGLRVCPLVYASSYLKQVVFIDELFWNDPVSKNHFPFAPDANVNGLGGNSYMQVCVIGPSLSKATQWLKDYAWRLFKRLSFFFFVSFFGALLSFQGRWHGCCNLLLPWCSFFFFSVLVRLLALYLFCPMAFSVAAQMCTPTSRQFSMQNSWKWLEVFIVDFSSYIYYWRFKTTEVSLFLLYAL